MAGKTLPGIGDDEESDGQSGEKDASSVSLSGANTEEPRQTDRMHHYSGPTIIDDDKVAEGLKRLRSLDEPLGPVGPIGPIPASMQTLKEGMPAVGASAPPATTATPAASAQGLAEILRARGTAHGHAITGPNAQGQVIVAPVGEDRMKGTLLGHMLHLPDLPPPTEERAVEVRPTERPGGGSVALTPIIQDFTHGEARFFDTEPQRELEPERPRSKLMVRGAIAFAVLSIGLVAAIAWVRAGRSDAAANDSVPVMPEAPTSNLPSSNLPSSATVIDNPNAAPAAAAEGTAAPAAAPSEPATAAPAAVPVPAALPEPAAETPRAPAPTTAAPRVHARPSHAAAATGASPSPSPRTPSVLKAPVPGKRAPVDKDDPDGTLPLSD